MNGVFGVGSLVEIATELGSAAIVSTGDDSCEGTGHSRSLLHFHSALRLVNIIEQIRRDHRHYMPLVILPQGHPQENK